MPSPVYCSTRPWCGLHDGGEALERAVHHRVDRLRVELLAHRGGADDVDEQHRHLLELLVRRRFGARSAASFAAQRRQRGVDHRVAEQRALRLERGDRGFELLPFLGHAEQDTNSTRPPVNACLTIPPGANGCFGGVAWRTAHGRSPALMRFD